MSSLGGWWLRGALRLLRKDALEAPSERAVLAGLQKIAFSMAEDVGHHTSKVQAINEELSAFEQPEAAAMAGLMNKLVATNCEMQERLKQAEQRLQEQARQIESHVADARTDALTNVPNRRAFDLAVAEGVKAFERDGTPFSMMILDVDHFKQLNDTYGHQAGDVVLQDIACVLQENVEQGNLVARYGGEEFAIVFPATSAAAAAVVAERARAAVGMTEFEFDDVKLKVTSSGGLAQLQPKESGDSLLRRADEALYWSKEAGRNCAHGHDGTKLYRLAAVPAKAPRAPRPKKSATRATALKSRIAAQAPGRQHEQSPWAGVVDTTTELSGKLAMVEDLTRRVAQRRRAGPSFCVVWVRIDNYSEIARQQGEHFGALVLRAATQFLKASMREMDHVARFGEDTFSLLLPGANLPNSTKVSERLRKAIERFQLPQGSGRPPFRFTVSMGVAEVAEHDSVEKLLERVQAACDRAASNGGNRSVFHDGHDLAEVETAL